MNIYEIHDRGSGVRYWASAETLAEAFELLAEFDPENQFGWSARVEARIMRSYESLTNMIGMDGEKVTRTVDEWIELIESGKHEPLALCSEY
jgi:hypothetical protein